MDIKSSKEKIETGLESNKRNRFLSKAFLNKIKGRCTQKKSIAVYLSSPNSTHLWQDPARTKAKDVADTETVRRCQVGV